MTDVNNNGLRIDRQDLSALSPESSDDGRIFNHDGASAITLVDGSSSANGGYYMWDHSAGAWNPMRATITDADTLDGYDSGAFARLDADETITGRWDLQSYIKTPSEATPSLRCFLDTSVGEDWMALLRIDDAGGKGDITWESNRALDHVWASYDKDANGWLARIYDDNRIILGDAGLAQGETTVLTDDGGVPMEADLDGGTNSLINFASATFSTDVTIGGSSVKSHMDSTANPHSVTAAQTNALALSGGVLSGDLSFDVGNSKISGPSDGPLHIDDGGFGYNDIRITTAGGAWHFYDAVNGQSNMIVREGGRVEIPSGEFHVSNNITASHLALEGTIPETTYSENLDDGTTQAWSTFVNMSDFVIRDETAATNHFRIKPDGRVLAGGDDVVTSSSGDYDIQKDGTDGAGVINFKTT